MAKKNLEGKHIRKPPKKRRGRHTKKVNKNKTYKEYVGQGRIQFMNKVNYIINVYNKLICLLTNKNWFKINENDYNPFREKL